MWLQNRIMHLIMKNHGIILNRYDFENFGYFKHCSQIQLATFWYIPEFNITGKRQNWSCSFTENIESNTIFPNFDKDKVPFKKPNSKSSSFRNYAYIFPALTLSITFWEPPYSK